MICEKCPAIALLDTAEELMAQVSHNEPDRTKGGIAITRKSLELIGDKIQCEGPDKNMNSQIVCPLQEIAYGARATATGPWLPTQYIVDLAQGITDKKYTNPRPGTYL